ncbi:MAG: hypothetical protein Kow0075_16390 [Salibacteraceae bacterium]
MECLNGAECEDGTCICPDGFSGTNCEIEDLCITQNPDCKHGDCVEGECDCHTNYYGEKCADKCVNGTYNSGVCECNTGFEGPSCETYSREKYLGAYTYTSGCKTGTLLTSIISEYDDEAFPERVSITNLSTDKDTDGYGVVIGDSLEIPLQTVKGATGNWKIYSLRKAAIVDGKFDLEINRRVAGTSGNGVNCTHKFERN